LQLLVNDGNRGSTRTPKFKAARNLLN